MENVPLIDVSSENDLLIPSSSQVLGIHTASSLEAEVEKVSKNLKIVPQLSDSPKQNQKGSDKYNLRKSLAWDSAFFTSEGILNTEELAIINSTHNKFGITLPGIQEELRKSSESTSESDSLVLEHLEVNLFENVRDSIQKSLGNSNHTTKMMHCDKIKEKKPDAPNARALKKIDVSSQIKLKPPTASRSNYATKQQQEHTSTSGLVCMNLPLHRNGELKHLIRPPKVSSKTVLLPTSVPGKKASIETSEIKSNTGKALPGATSKQQSIVAFDKANAVPCITRRTTLSTKSISGSQTDLALTANLGSSSSSTTSCSSVSKSVLSLAVVEKRSADRITSHFSSRTSKIPLNISRIGSKEGSNRPILAKSSLVLSEVSPASSIDTVTSESSSSASTSTKLGKSLEGSDAGSSSPSVAFSSSLVVSQNSGSLSQSFIDDGTKSYKNGDFDARLTKPSGLRMPRPTIGYFDKEKNLVPGSNKAPKASLQNNLAKNTGVKYVGATNIVKPIDLPTVRDRRLPSALSKQASKSAKVEAVHQKLRPIVNKIYSETVEQKHKINFNDGRVPIDEVQKVQSCNPSKNEEPNLLHANVFGRVNETETIGEQITHNQQENVKKDLKAADRETEKENLWNNLKTEDPTKMQQMGDQYAAAMEQLGGKISSLSLSEAKDVSAIY